MRLLVDGPNYSGKTSLIKAFSQALPGLTVLEVHDTGHLHILRQQHLRVEDLYLPAHWAALSIAAVDASVAYLDKRDHAFVGLVANLEYDDILLERIPLTSFVYKLLLFDREEPNTLQELDRILAGDETILVCVTAAPEVLIERAGLPSERKALRAGSYMPTHLVDPNMLEKKCEMYEHALGYIKRCRVERCDTSDFTLANLADWVAKLLDCTTLAG
jgi:hypothetical protein